MAYKGFDNRAAGEREINWGCGNRCGEDLEFGGTCWRWRGACEDR